jgi:hypothetical protein
LDGADSFITTVDYAWNPLWFGEQLRHFTLTGDKLVIRTPEQTAPASRAVPSAAARPPPVRCERNMPASSIPQTWYACILTLPHLVITGSPYYSAIARISRFGRFSSRFVQKISRLSSLREFARKLLI